MGLLIFWVGLGFLFFGGSAVACILLSIRMCVMDVLGQSIYPEG